MYLSAAAFTDARFAITHVSKGWVDRVSDLVTSEETLTQSAAAKFPMGCLCLGGLGILGKTTNLPSRTTKVFRYKKDLHLIIVTL
jgi:hypothetical protein